MARILPNDLAPDEVVHYSFAGVEFDLGAGDAYETEDRQVLGNADVHPWLTVEYPQVEVIGGEVRRTLADRPDLDALSGMGPNANDPYDPEKIAATEAAKAEARKNPVALDAALDQGTPVAVESADRHVAVTLAADEGHEGASSPDAFKLDEDQAAAAAAGQTSEEPAFRPAIDPDTTDTKDNN